MVYLKKRSVDRLDVSPPLYLARVCPIGPRRVGRVVVCIQLIEEEFKVSNILLKLSFHRIELEYVRRWMCALDMSRALHGDTVASGTKLA